MPKYVIEREIPGIGDLSATQIRNAAQESNGVIGELGAADIQWLHSYVTGDKLYCVYIARDEDIVREHARCLDVPASQVSRVVTTMDPTSAD